MLGLKSSHSIADLRGSHDSGLADTQGHSSKFIQVLDESMCVVREDLTEWLQRYLFSTASAPPLDAPYLLHRLQSGLWLSRLAQKLNISVFQAGSTVPMAPNTNTTDQSYEFLRGAVSNKKLNTLSKASLPQFPQTLVTCARIPLGVGDLQSFDEFHTSSFGSGDGSASSSIYSSSNSASSSPNHSPTLPPSQETSQPVVRMRVADRWAARDNVSVFIQWCRDLGIPQTVLFETTGLVHRTEEKNVLLTLMELARIAARFGLADLPELVRMELEIDMIEARHKAQSNANGIQLPPLASPVSPVDTVIRVEGGGGGEQEQDSHVPVSGSAKNIISTLFPANIGVSTTPTNTSTTQSIHRSLVARDTPCDESSPPARDRSELVIDIRPYRLESTESNTGLLGHDMAVGMDGHDSHDVGVNCGTQIGPSGDGGHEETKTTTPLRRPSDPFVVDQTPSLGSPFVPSGNSQELVSTPTNCRRWFVNERKRGAQLPQHSLQSDDMCTPPKVVRESIDFDRIDCITPKASPLISTDTPVTVLRGLHLDSLSNKQTNFPPEAVTSQQNQQLSSLHFRGGSIDDRIVAEQVRKNIEQCTCCDRIHMQHLQEGRYRLGKRIYYLRRFRHHVMVRVGGGWLTLDQFLDRHDPCRRRRNGQGDKSVRPSIDVDMTNLPVEMKKSLMPDPSKSLTSFQRRWSKRSTGSQDSHTGSEMSGDGSVGRKSVSSLNEQVELKSLESTTVFRNPVDVVVKPVEAKSKERLTPSYMQHSTASSRAKATTIRTVKSSDRKLSTPTMSGTMRDASNESRSRASSSQRSKQAASSASNSRANSPLARGQPNRLGRSTTPSNVRVTGTTPRAASTTRATGSTRNLSTTRESRTRINSSNTLQGVVQTPNNIRTASSTRVPSTIPQPRVVPPRTQPIV